WICLLFQPHIHRHYSSKSHESRCAERATDHDRRSHPLPRHIGCRILMVAHCGALRDPPRPLVPRLLETSAPQAPGTTQKLLRHVSLNGTESFRGREARTRRSGTVVRRLTGTPAARKCGYAPARPGQIEFALARWSAAR